jgi:hypothetical protein
MFNSIAEIYNPAKLRIALHSLKFEYRLTFNLKAIPQKLVIFKTGTVDFY